VNTAQQLAYWGRKAREATKEADLTVTLPRTIHVTTTGESHILPEGVANAGGVMASHKSDHVLVMDGHRYGFGYSDADTWVNRGPGMGRKFITEPEGYVYGLAVCIDNYGGTGAEAARNRAAGTETDVDYGDYVVTDGDLVFKIVEHYSHGHVIDRHYPFALEYVGHLADIPGGTGDN
jgi:hypothetical protein